ncbi:MAG TPA: malonyl-CoA synthase [Povalibacter sp.]|nr:malonyl-CoA synthase [Povalibacter sp.]
MSSANDPLDWVAAVLQQDADRLLLETTDGRRFSYCDFDALSGRLAAALALRGVVAGDRVAAQVDKSAEAVALYMACLRLGAVFVPLNTAYTLVELDYFLGDSSPRVAVVRPQMLGEASSLHRGVRFETLTAGGDGSLTELAAGCAAKPHDPAVRNPAALAALLYTSGTTGRSKGAMLSRGNLATNAATLAHSWRFTTTDVLLHALPIFHVHGLFVAINAVLASGSSMLFLPRFDAEEVVRLLPRCSVFMGVPTFYTRLLQQPALNRETTRNMRLFVSGSAPLLPETHREFRERTGYSILERYGMSETLMNTSNPYDGERIPGSVGPALPGVEVRVTDPESGTVLTQPDAVGMIEVRGPNAFSGYWRLPERTAAEFRSDGFFITGDLGRIDAQGYVYVVGRGKDLIISGGYNVYPIEVESEIDALPGVSESAVVGVPHPDFGEGVIAVVVREKDATIDETFIRNALQARLANFKLPKRVMFVEELPRNTMGKVQKGLLRETCRDLFAPTGNNIDG